MPEPEWFVPASSPSEARLQTKRNNQLRRARAAIYLACEMTGPHMAVVLLNDALREQLDKLHEGDTA
jgi:hypothetical protein